MAYTGANGSFTINGYTGVVRNATVDISRDALETTNLGDYSRTYTPGLVGATGNATFIYEAEIKSNLIANVLNTASTRETPIAVTLTVGTGQTIAGSVFITQVGTSVSVGDVTSTNVAFQFTGAPS
jgi:hypothetical protein